MIISEENISKMPTYLIGSDVKYIGVTSMILFLFILGAIAVISFAIWQPIKNIKIMKNDGKNIKQNNDFKKEIIKLSLIVFLLSLALIALGLVIATLAGTIGNLQNVIVNPKWTEWFKKMESEYGVDEMKKWFDSSLGWIKY